MDEKLKLNLSIYSTKNDVFFELRKRWKINPNNIFFLKKILFAYQTKKKITSEIEVIIQDELKFDLNLKKNGLK